MKFSESERGLTCTLALDGDNRETTCDLALGICEMPTCGCDVVYIELQPPAATTTDVVRFDVDVSERTVARKSPDAAAASRLVSQFGDADWQWLSAKFRELKKHLMADADLCTIEYPFDFDEIMETGAKQFYLEVFPHAEELLFSVDGTRYLAIEQHCVVPGCKCADVTLSFAEIPEKAETRDESLKAFLVANLEVNKRRWHDREVVGPSRAATEDVLRQFLIEWDVAVLAERRRVLRQLYRYNYNRVLAAAKAAKGPGRNSPCPCGSGKKYKRCCG
jgi:hypothetical protein